LFSGPHKVYVEKPGKFSPDVLVDEVLYMQETAVMTVKAVVLDTGDCTIIRYAEEKDAAA
jgi:hypothetical protein